MTETTGPLPLLALDLSTPATLVALQVSPSHYLFRREVGGGRSEALFPTVRDLLEEAGLAPGGLAAVGVGRGPGSFTGVRTAVMAAKALSWALGLPLLAPTTLDVLARGVAGDGVIASLVDARRGQVYLRVFLREEEALSPLTDPQALTPQEARDLILGLAAGRDRELILVGTGAHAYRDLLAGLGRIAEDPFPLPRALLAACEEEAEAGPRDALELTPLYLRDPDAVPPKGKDCSRRPEGCPG